MATLVLTRAGGAVAGPLGAAVGSALGRAVNSRLGSVPTPVLTDLRIQSSSYGVLIPSVLGKMRVAGTVIWASDLVQGARASKESVRTAYSVSFAVALSSRLVRGIGRIWADGRLIRGAAGDHKIPFRARLLPGEEDQAPDPLIASIEGLGRTPGFRGLAVLVLEDFDLSSFGNRIPQISVEVDAGGSLQAHQLVSDVLEIEVSSAQAGPAIKGYVLNGQSAGEALSPVAEALASYCTFNASPRLHVLSPARSVAEDGADEAPETAVPSEVVVSFFDEQADFNLGSKRAALRGMLKTKRVDFPGVFSGEDARGLAENLLARAWTERRQIEFKVPLADAPSFRVGDRVTTPDPCSSEYRISRVTLRSDHAALLLVRQAGPMLAIAGEPGGYKPPVDVEAAPLRLAIAEVPRPGGAGLSQLQIACRGGAHYRLQLDVFIGGAVRMMDAPELPAIIGTLEAPLGSAPADAIDNLNTIELQLDGDEWLVGVEDADLLAGANLAVVGSEILQFGTVAHLGDGRHRLGRLIRGKCGSAAGHHPTGSQFFLLEPARLVTLDVPLERLGSEVEVAAVDDNGHRHSERKVFSGERSWPLSPVHPRVRERDGGLEISWIRRSRLGGAWLDHVDCPLGEARERYLVSLQSSVGRRQELSCDQPRCFVPPGIIEELGSGQMHVSIRQVGDFGVSPPCNFSIQ
jgi:hypothetical protein